MIELLYFQDSYLQECSAVVENVNGNSIALDKTIFYPQGGGQPSDTGKIICSGNEFLVINVSKKENKVWHEIDKGGLKIGDKVRCVLNWARRYSLMRMHTAAHILCAVINKETGALITGNQLDVVKSRIDFNLDNFDREKMQQYFDESNELISKGAKVEIYFMPREDALKLPHMVKLAGALPPQVKELRIVKINGVDEQADGGTHVKDINEVGKIVFLSAENKGKDNRRVYYTLDKC